MRKLVVAALGVICLVGLVLVTACSARGESPSESSAVSSTATSTVNQEAESGDLAKATFAGGCFWCMEAPFDKLDGVRATISGYTAGHLVDPTYRQVSSGGSGHTEAIQVTYDPAKISYEELLDVFWKNIDPEAVDRQFCDRGTQYRSGIYFHDEAQRKAAEATKKSLEEGGKLRRVATEIEALDVFYPAEEYHQDFYLKNPGRYNSYRKGCGRDRRLKELWGSSH